MFHRRNSYPRRSHNSEAIRPLLLITSGKKKCCDPRSSTGHALTAAGGAGKLKTTTREAMWGKIQGIFHVLCFDRPQSRESIQAEDAAEAALVVPVVEPAPEVPSATVPPPNLGSHGTASRNGSTRTRHGALGWIRGDVRADAAARSVGEAIGAQLEARAAVFSFTQLEEKSTAVEMHIRATLVRLVRTAEAPWIGGEEEMVVWTAPKEGAVTRWDGALTTLPHRTSGPLSGGASKYSQ
jgi:hypothetical protein